jgi:ABC-type uncharacterized transport system substrate-binding protein
MCRLLHGALALSFFSPFFAHAYTGVTIVMSAPTSMNQEFVEHFKDELATKKNLNLKVKVVDLQDVDKLAVAENSELVIALGVKALQLSSKLKTTTPVLGVFTPLPAFNDLLETSKRDLGNFGAIVLDQPYVRQMLLIKVVLPEAKSVGLLLGSTSLQYEELLKEAGEKNGLTVLEERVSQDSELIPKLKKTLEVSDALMAIPDPLIYNRETAQPILLTSYRHQKPVFGYSQSYVRAGALAAVYSSAKQIAKQAVEIALKAQASGALPPPQIPKYFSVMVNPQVARSLNIPLMDEEELQKKMLRLETTQNEEYRN